MDLDGLAASSALWAGRGEAVGVLGSARSGCRVRQQMRRLDEVVGAAHDDEDNEDDEGRACRGGRTSEDCEEATFSRRWSSELERWSRSSMRICEEWRRMPDGSEVSSWSSGGDRRRGRWGVSCSSELMVLRAVVVSSRRGGWFTATGRGTGLRSWRSSGGGWSCSDEAELEEKFGEVGAWSEGSGQGRRSCGRRARVLGGGQSSGEMGEARGEVERGCRLRGGRVTELWRRWRGARRRRVEAEVEARLGCRRWACSGLGRSCRRWRCSWASLGGAASAAWWLGSGAAVVENEAKAGVGLVGRRSSSAKSSGGEFKEEMEVVGERVGALGGGVVEMEGEVAGTEEEGGGLVLG